MTRYFKISIIIFLVFTTQISVAQLTTSNSSTVAELIQDVLAGEGVEISNVTFKGNVRQRGQFWGPSNIGLNNGVVISTGTVLDQTLNGRKVGPVGPNNNTGANHVSHSPVTRDQDLADLANRQLNETMDAVVIEFDFIPEGDTINFRYVFASEEYPEDYKSQGINDVFGFFISGPGISGSQNIALLNDGVTEVSISTVNPETNTSIYNSNGNGIPGTSHFTNNNIVNYDGFTNVLTAQSRVQPCQTYHLKIAICDIVDPSYDTGVFLEANSLKSAPSYSFEQGSDVEIPNDSFPSNRLIAGCTNGELTLKRTEKLNELLVVPFYTTGDAVEGTDYSISHNNQITFNPGDDEVVIEINPIDHAGLIAARTLNLTFDNPKVCEPDPEVTFEYTIERTPDLNVFENNLTLDCVGDSIEIEALASGGVPPLTFNWNDFATQDKNVMVSPSVDTQYSFDVEDFCGQTSVQEDVNVQIPNYDPLLVSVSNDQNFKCKGLETTLAASASDGAGDYVYEWNNGMSGDTIDVMVMGDFLYEVEVTDKCGEQISADINIELSVQELIADGGNDKQVCVGDEVTLFGSASGGVPNNSPNGYDFYWDQIQGPEYVFNAIETKSYILSVYDSCNIVPSKDTVEVMANQPKAGFSVDANLFETNEQINFRDESEGATFYEWDFGDGRASAEQSPENTFDDDGEYVITQIVFDGAGCVDTLRKTIKIEPPLYYHLPNAFTPNEDGINDVYLGVGEGVNELELIIYNRWGEVVFQTTDPTEPWDGRTTSGKELPTGVYVAKYRVQGKDEDRIIESIKSVFLTR